MKLQRIRFSSVFRLALIATMAALLANQTFAGSIGRLFYYGVPGGAVSDLTNAVIFPNTPTYREQLDDFNPPTYGLQSKQDTTTGFGSYTRGYLEAPTTGTYTFFIASDDASQLWLGLNTTPASRQLIAYETTYCTTLFSGARLAQRRSVPIALVRGQKYYLEVLHQQSGGASHIKVGWERPDGVQEVIPTLHVAQYPDDPYLGTSYTAPVFNPFGLNSGDLPASVTVNEGNELVLQVDAIAAQPTTFQWYRNGTVVPGENLSFLKLPAVPGSANGDNYHVVVANGSGSLTSATATLSVTPDNAPPILTKVEARGNPHGVRLTYSEAVSPATATNIANYALQSSGGASLVITSATLTADQRVVQLAGSFSFQLGTTYQLTASGILDQAAVPNALLPNPTVANFDYATPSGTAYSFDEESTDGFSLYGSVALVTSGSLDGSGYVKLTDAAPYQRGIVLFTNRSTVDQFYLKFKTRIGDASPTPGDGYSINLGADLPQGTFLRSQEGFTPFTTPAADRFIVAFDNARTVGGVRSPAIVVKWRGEAITNVLSGVVGVPAISSAEGHWANVEIQLQRGGRLSLNYDGVLIFTNLATGFVPVASAQLAIAAQTGANYATHWFDDIVINYAAGDIGPVAWASVSGLINRTVKENQTATFSVVPSGASPYTYQWYHDGNPVPDATESALSVVGSSSSAGDYWVVLANEFSQATSGSATLSVVADTTAPHLLRTSGSAELNRVLLVFDEPLDPISATNIATYEFGFLPLHSASLSEDGKSVILSTGTLEREQLYLFTICGLKDRSVAGNPLTTTGTFIDLENYAVQVALDGAKRYWPFEELKGSSTIQSLTTGADALSLGIAALNNGPTLGVPGLALGSPVDSGILFTASSSQNVVVPNGTDVNITSGPWAKKSFELWFRANTVPEPGTTGLAATAGLFEQGAQNRGAGLYLWRDPSDPNPDQAQLIFHAVNNLSDGAGSPWGVTNGQPQNTIYVSAAVTTGQVYHVVAVLQGKAAPADGQLLLYTNGVLAATTNGAGFLYGHTGGAPRIGVGSGGFRHDGIAFVNTQYFDGVVDEFILYNSALSSERIATHFQVGLTAPLLIPTAPINHPPVISGYGITNNKLLLIWNGTAQLQRATNSSGPFIDVSGATSPYQETPTNGQAYFRLVP